MAVGHLSHAGAPSGPGCSFGKEIEEPMEKIQKAGYITPQQPEWKTKEWKGYAFSATLKNVVVPWSQSSSTPTRFGLGLTSGVSLLLYQADSWPSSHSTLQD